MIKGRIGAEIECYFQDSKFSEVKELVLNNHWKIESDGSIHSPDSGDWIEKEIKFDYSISEINTMFEKVKELFELVEVNDSCGLHFHVSFEDSTYYFKLCKYDFIKYFQEIIDKAFKTPKERKRINYHYCQFYKNEGDFLTSVSNQINSYNKDGSRQHSVNFNSFNIHNTIEFRIFASTNSIRKFKSYTNLLLKSLSKYIKTQKEIKFDFSANVQSARKQAVFREVID